MVSRVVAARYAKGLLGAVLETADGEEALTRVRSELEALAEAISGHGGLRHLLVNPAISWERKAAVIDEIAERVGTTEISRRFLRQVAEKERLDHLEVIVEQFGDSVDEHLGVITAQVTTPTRLSDDAVGALRQRLEESTGLEVRLGTRSDPDLLGGLVTRIGDVVYDGSLRRHLDRIRSRMVTGRDVESG